MQCLLAVPTAQHTRRAIALGRWQARGARRGRQALGVVRGQTRHPRSTLQGGLPGTVDDEASFVPDVLSRGRRRYGHLRLQPAARTIEARRRAPSLSRGASSFTRRRLTGIRSSEAAIQRRPGWRLASGHRPNPRETGVAMCDARLVLQSIAATAVTSRSSLPARPASARRRCCHGRWRPCAASAARARCGPGRRGADRPSGLRP